MRQNSSSNDAGLTVQIRDVASGFPGPNVLATAAVLAADVPGITTQGGWVAVPFAAPASVNANTQYSIVVYTGEDSQYGWYGSTANPYSGGSGALTPSSPPSLPWTGDPTDDHAFKTYVTTEPPTEQCNGQDATIVGTAGEDELEGTSGTDVIVGLGGDEEIEGEGGNDVICGGDGRDDISGDSGHDTLNGEGNSDDLEGNTGNDTLNGGLGSDGLSGGKDDDALNGDAGNDELYGHTSTDILKGGTGDDRLDGSSGGDTLDGEDGADKLFGGDNNDNLTGGAGSPDSCEGGSGTDSGGSGCETKKSIP